MNAANSGVGFDAGSGLWTSELAAQITGLVGHLNAANRRSLALIAEFDRRKGLHDGLTLTCAHWLNWMSDFPLPRLGNDVSAET